MPDLRGAALWTLPLPGCWRNIAPARPMARPAGDAPRVERRADRTFPGSLLLARVVPDGLDIIAIGIVDERRIVTGRIVAIAGAAVILAASRKGPLVEPF